jgi:hypothetical protein
MRKHRLFGVVIAVLIGLGACTHRSGAPHRTPGTRAGFQLASAALPAGADMAPAPTASQHDAVAADRTDAGPNHTGPNGALFAVMAGHGAALLSSPFSPQTLVWDVRLAQMDERAEAVAYVTAVAQQRAMAEAYLRSLAAHPTPARTPAATAVVRAPAPVLRNPLASLRQCESGGNYGDNTGNGYYGAYQFNVGTWRALGFGGLPSQASPSEQDQAAQELQARRGWSQWPSCARRLGL